MGEMLNNSFDNLQYTLASGIGSNPVLNSIFKVGRLLQDTVGGIALPTVTYLGTGYEANSSVAELLLAGALGGSMIDGIVSLIGNGGGGALGIGGFNPALDALGAFGGNVLTRGNGNPSAKIQSGFQISQSAYIGNEEEGGVYTKTMQDQEDKKTQAIQQAEEDDSDRVTIKDVNESVLMIYNLLSGAIDPAEGLKVYPAQGAE